MYNNRRAIAWIILGLVGFALLFAVLPSPSHAVSWKTAGASVFGGACESGVTGYRGDYLPSKPNSFAELGMGNALGGLPYKAKIRLLYRHRKVTVVKRDIGLGGGDVGGLPRTIDLWAPAQAKLTGRLNCNWTGVVHYRRVG